MTYFMIVFFTDLAISKLNFFSFFFIAFSTNFYFLLFLTNITYFITFFTHSFLFKDLLILCFQAFFMIVISTYKTLLHLIRIKTPFVTHKTDFYQFVHLIDLLWKICRLFSCLFFVFNDNLMEKWENLGWRKIFLPLFFFRISSTLTQQRFFQIYWKIMHVIIFLS